MEATKKDLNGSQGTGNWQQWVGKAVLMGGLAAFAVPSGFNVLVIGLASCQLVANGRSYRYGVHITVSPIEFPRRLICDCERVGRHLSSILCDSHNQTTIMAQFLQSKQKCLALPTAHTGFWPLYKVR